MKKKVTEDQIEEIRTKGRMGTITWEDVQAFLSNPKRYTSRSVESRLRKNVTGPDTDRDYPVIIDCGESLESMIAKVSNGHNPDINSENFPTFSNNQPRVTVMGPYRTSGKEIFEKLEVVLKLFVFRRPVATRYVLSYIAPKFFRGATLVEFLAFAHTYPEVWRNYRVAALGSSWLNEHGRVGIPFILESGKLDLNYRSDWNENFCFLAAPKHSVEPILRINI